MSDASNAYSGICHIAVGANIQPETNIPNALDLLNRHTPITAVSTFFRTKAINRPEQDDYLNGAVSIHYAGPLRDLKHLVLRRVEELLGRKRTNDPYAPRTIDLDIALCGDIVLKTPELVLPDPDIRQRAFLAAALLELEPELIMPDSRVLLRQEISPELLSTLIPADAFSKALKERFHI